MRDAAAHDLLRAEAADRSRRPARWCRTRRRAMPLIARNSVDLPAPLAPRIATRLPVLDLDRDVAQRLDRTVAHAETADLKHRRPRRDRRPSPWRRASTSAGGPLAMSWPRSSTTRRSHSRDTNGMLCSTTRMPRPNSRRRPSRISPSRATLDIVEAGDRLVEQQEADVHQQRAAEIDQLAMAVRQAADPSCRRCRRCRAAPARRRPCRRRRAPAAARSAAAAVRRAGRNPARDDRRSAGCRAPKVPRPVPDAETPGRCRDARRSTPTAPRASCRRAGRALASAA